MAFLSIEISDASAIEVLSNLTAAFDRNTAALTALTAQGVGIMATLADLTAAANTIVSDDSNVKAAIDKLANIINGATSLTAADQAALDAAVNELQTAHTDMVAEVNDALQSPPVAP
jgi:hypothetical protein